jgi:hypothetical protein
MYQPERGKSTGCKKAAFKSGAAFWDMYKAMGGENSMPSWVFAEPAGIERFVHFNHEELKP